MTMTIVADMSLLDSEVPSPKSLKLEVNGGSQLLALGELEFKKAFLLLSYIPGYVYAAFLFFFSYQSIFKSDLFC